jgi:hypothetical protein
MLTLATTKRCRIARGVPADPSHPFFAGATRPMAKPILIDEFHLSVLVPRGLPEAEYSVIRQTLDDARLHVALRRAIQEVFRLYPSLRKTKVQVSP